MKKEYIATFQVKFNPDTMCADEDLKKSFGGSWNKCIEFLFKEEGIGIFDEDLEFTGIFIDHQSDKINDLPRDTVHHKEPS